MVVGWRCRLRSQPWAILSPDGSWMLEGDGRDWLSAIAMERPAQWDSEQEGDPGGRNHPTQLRCRARYAERAEVGRGGLGLRQ